MLNVSARSEGKSEDESAVVLSQRLDKECENNRKLGPQEYKYIAVVLSRIPAFTSEYNYYL